MKKILIAITIMMTLMAPQKIECECHDHHQKGEVCECEKCAECIYCLPEVKPYCDNDVLPIC